MITHTLMKGNSVRHLITLTGHVRMPQRHEMEPQCLGVSGLSHCLNMIVTLLLFMTFKIYLNVNCSTITYETEPSNTVWSAVQKAKAELALLVAAGSTDNGTQEILERWLC